VGAISHYKDFLRDNGFLAGDFDVEEWVDRRPFDLVDIRAANAA
jgi:ABC-type nitrate/sulfonate/bicarbonate transport system substrate-binding protein